jgi:hypothetical protein
MTNGTIARDSIDTGSQLCVEFWFMRLSVYMSEDGDLERGGKGEGEE